MVMLYDSVSTISSRFLYVAVRVTMKNGDEISDKKTNAPYTSSRNRSLLVKSEIPYSHYIPIPVADIMPELALFHRKLKYTTKLNLTWYGGH